MGGAKPATAASAATAGGERCVTAVCGKCELTNGDMSLWQIRLTGTRVVTARYGTKCERIRCHNGEPGNGNTAGGGGMRRTAACAAATATALHGAAYGDGGDGDTVGGCAKASVRMCRATARTGEYGKAALLWRRRRVLMACRCATAYGGVANGECVENVWAMSEWNLAACDDSATR